MKRQLPGLADVARDSRPELPDGIFLPCRWCPLSLACAETVLRFPALRRRAQRIRWLPDYRPPLLHAESNVEACLVPARFPLRP